MQRSLTVLALLIVALAIGITWKTRLRCVMTNAACRISAPRTKLTCTVHAQDRLFQMELILRPAIHKLQIGEQAAKRIVLGDWDRQGWALQVDEQGFALAAFDFVPPPQLALPGN